MVIYFKIAIESIKQALSALATNKLRTFLSLLGILIGIFSIIAVMSAVDSLEDNIKNGFSELGSDVIYIDKMPWNEDPNQNYWKYMKRPDPKIEDYNAITDKSKLADFANLDLIQYCKEIHQCQQLKDGRRNALSQSQRRSRHGRTQR